MSRVGWSVFVAASSYDDHGHGSCEDHGHGSGDELCHKSCYNHCPGSCDGPFPIDKDHLANHFSKYQISDLAG